jgi:hypothetical protein
VVPRQANAHAGDVAIAYQARGSGRLDPVQLDIGDAPDYDRRVVAVLTFLRARGVIT